MRHSFVRSVGQLAALVLVGTAATRAAAQSACVTPDCTLAGTPTQCTNRAQALMPTVLLTTSGINFVFDPSSPKIEPGDCVIWRAVSVTHSSSGNGCSTSTLCTAAPLPTCEYETGNVSSGAANPTSTCFYDPIKFPVGTGQGFFCRFHATPTTGTMRGTLRVTTPIDLTVDKVIATNSVKLTWSGGGVAGDVTYKVAKNNAGDPVFPTGTTTTLTPDGGNTGTTLTDTGELASATTKYYLVRNKQTNEP